MYVFIILFSPANVKQAADHPGILVPIYDPPLMEYTIPGPPLWTPGSSNPPAKKVVASPAKASKSATFPDATLSSSATNKNQAAKETIEPTTTKTLKGEQTSIARERST